ncbi:hypothetical protein PLICRDRAFT_692884 [Plicaturopsis crispa FD-325 SS-3]|nr:hypothetical protein PLICRDRAFT_692884 [Plicaturopsis crispa FD-325 SS-3]
MPRVSLVFHPLPCPRTPSYQSKTRARPAYSKDKKITKKHGTDKATQKRGDGQPRRRLCAAFSSLSLWHNWVPPFLYSHPSKYPVSSFQTVSYLPPQPPPSRTMNFMPSLDYDYPADYAFPAAALIHPAVHKLQVGTYVAVALDTAASLAHVPTAHAHATSSARYLALVNRIATHQDVAFPLEVELLLVGANPGATDSTTPAVPIHPAPTTARRALRPSPPLPIPAALAHHTLHRLTVLVSAVQHGATNARPSVLPPHDVARLRTAAAADAARTRPPSYHSTPSYHPRRPQPPAAYDDDAITRLSFDGTDDCAFHIDDYAGAGRVRPVCVLSTDLAVLSASAVGAPARLLAEVERLYTLERSARAAATSTRVTNWIHAQPTTAYAPPTRFAASSSARHTSPSTWQTSQPAWPTSPPSWPTSPPAWIDPGRLAVTSEVFLYPDSDISSARSRSESPEYGEGDGCMQEYGDGSKRGRVHSENRQRHGKHGGKRAPAAADVDSGAPRKKRAFGRALGTLLSAVGAR